MAGRRPRDEDRFALSPEIVLRAYAAGIFPMADGRDSEDLYWVDPEERGVLPLEGFHVARRLKRTLRQGKFRVYTDTAFTEVILACAEETADRGETWINDEIVRLFTELHEMGFAHSIEAWQDAELAGGLYGVAIGGAFFGESMFSRHRDASKVALVHLAARLWHGGFKLLDAQFVTEHLRSFGAIGISRTEYRRRLSKALEAPAQFASDLAPDESDSVVMRFLQSTTQTS